MTAPNAGPTPRTDEVCYTATEDSSSYERPSEVVKADFARQLERENAALVALVERYISAYPAFRMKPIGAEGSLARIEQENLMALEDQARAALALARKP